MLSGRGVSRPHRRARATAVFGVAAALVGVLAPGVGGASVSSGHAVFAGCPWASATFDAQHTPSQLAAMVVGEMTLGDKLDLLNLAAARGYENSTTAIKALCIPALTLQDGPDGLSYGDRGVTQLPASLGLAATFDTSLAERYVAVEGNEARRQGIDAVQGPNLNIDRVPQSGRAFEGYGEDPFLVSQMGVANIEGIQSQGVMADAKHFTAYNEETDRLQLNQQIETRALEEIYLPPFKAAVADANVASIMCAYGSINGVGDCADPRLYHLLGKWGFRGFVRSDLGAVTDAPAAFAAGMDEIKPAEPASLVAAISSGALSMARVDDAVERILAEMFTYGMIQRPIVGKPDTQVTNAAHAQLALEVAERSMVLLKNRGDTLPLSSSHVGSIAVIGADASTGEMAVGLGSARVLSATESTPLDAIRAAVSRGTKVFYAPGGSSTASAPTIARRAWKLAKPSFVSNELARVLRPSVLHAIVGTGSFGTAAELLRHASTTITVPRSGSYVFSLTSTGDTWLAVGGDAIISSPGIHSIATWSAGDNLVGGHRYTIGLTWYPRSVQPVVGVRVATSPIADAVAAARHAKVAVVFASDVSSEGVDRSSLDLPSDENTLISAVAAVNRHTVVVLNTAGAVYMPWLAKVAAVVEAWYPGEQDGRATAAVLFGKIDPSGRLPVTFPRSANEVPAHTRASFPGTLGTVPYTEGVDVGYRYDDALGLQPLFPFGYGLSYTTFSLADLVATPSVSGVDADVTVTNTGLRSGTEVVQAYLAFPTSAGEPPLQLKAFATVTLGAGQSEVVTLKITPDAFETYLANGWQTVPGTYGLFVGTSSASLPLVTALPAPVTISASTKSQMPA